MKVFGWVALVVTFASFVNYLTIAKGFLGLNAEIIFKLSFLPLAGFFIANRNFIYTHI